jgi:hypothetical protein
LIATVDSSRFIEFGNAKTRKNPHETTFQTQDIAANSLLVYSSYRNLKGQRQLYAVRIEKENYAVLRKKNYA